MSRRISGLMAAAMLSAIGMVGTAPLPPAHREEDPYAKAAPKAYKTKKKNGEPRKVGKHPALAAPYGTKKSSFNRSTKGSPHFKVKR